MAHVAARVDVLVQEDVALLDGAAVEPVGRSCVLTFVARDLEQYSDRLSCDTFKNSSAAWYASRAVPHVRVDGSRARTNRGRSLVRPPLDDPRPLFEVTARSPTVLTQVS